MPERRTVVVVAPPFLADIVRRVVAVRADTPGARRLRILDTDDLAAWPRDDWPDIVILGPDASRSSSERSTSLHARVLALSADLTRLLGPGPDDSVPLTADALAGRLREIMETI